VYYLNHCFCRPGEAMPVKKKSTANIKNEMKGRNKVGYFTTDKPYSMQVNYKQQPNYLTA